MLMMSEERRKARFVLFKCLEGDMKGRMPTTPSDFHILNRGREPRGQKDWLELCLSALPSYTRAVMCQFSFSVIWVPGWVWIGKKFSMGRLGKGGRGRSKHRLGELRLGWTTCTEWSRSQGCSAVQCVF